MSLLASLFWRIVARLIRLGQQAVNRHMPRWSGAYARLVLPIIAYRVHQLIESEDKEPS